MAVKKERKEPSDAAAAAAGPDAKRKRDDSGGDTRNTNRREENNARFNDRGVPPGKSATRLFINGMPVWTSRNRSPRATSSNRLTASFDAKPDTECSSTWHGGQGESLVPPYARGSVSLSQCTWD